MSHPSRPAARSVAELIGGTLDPIVRKRGLARAELLSWWPDIVGEAFAGRTVPERIRWPRGGGAAVLVVRCDPSLALQFSYELDGVRERLNTYFGYPAVASVRIVQHRVGVDEKKTAIPRDDVSLPGGMEERLAELDSPLGDSLRNLGRLIIART